MSALLTKRLSHYIRLVVKVHVANLPNLIGQEVIVSRFFVCF